jgi:hypothetical protein
MELTPYQRTLLHYIMPDALMYQPDESVKKEESKKEEIVKKEMSKEEFVESEHPRDPSGKFTDKIGGGGEKLHPEKGSWGGGREHAGRLPKEAHNAVPKLKERFRKKNPEATEEQINQMVTDYAKNNLKPDILEYQENPDNYYKKLEESRRDAMLDKYRKTHFQGKPVKNVYNSDDTSQIKDEVRGSASKWKRAIEERKSIEEAKEIYENEEATQSEKNMARLITGAATVASAVGLWALLRKRPNFIGAGLKELEHIGEGKSAAERAMRALSEENTANPLEMIKGKFLHTLDVIPRPPKTSTDNPFPIDRATQIYKEDVGSFRKVLSRTLGLSEDKVAALGPPMGGYGPRSRYKLGDRYTVDPNSRNYRIKEGDFDAKTGLVLIDKTGRPDLINIAIAENVIAAKPKDSFRMVKNNKTGELEKKPYTPDGLRRSKDGERWELEAGSTNETKFLEFLKSEKNGVLQRTAIEDISKPEKGSKVAVNPSKRRRGKKGNKINPPTSTPEEKTDKKKTKTKDVVVEGKAEYDAENKVFTAGEKKFVYTVRTENLPLIGRRWTTGSGGELERNAAAVNEYKSWSEFLEGQVYGPLSRSILAKLTVATGASASGMYYFQQDIEQAIHERMQTYREERDAQEQQRKLEAQGRRAEQSKKKSEIDRIEAETKLEKQRTERAKQQKDLEMLRENVVNTMIKYGFRKPQEGAVTEFSRVTSVLNKMEPDARQAYMERALTRDLLSEYGYADSPNGYRELHSDLQQDTVKSHEVLETIAENLKKELAKDGVIPDSEGTIKDQNLKVTTPKPGVRNKKGGAKKKEFYDIILKAFQDEELKKEDKSVDIEEVIDRLSTEVAKMISDMSESCMLMIENGVPGHSKYEQLNDILVEIYGYMKDLAKHHKPEKPEISTKSFDKSFETPYMSTQSDSGGGMFTGRKKPNAQEKCPKCQSMATEEAVNKCDKADCPYSFIDMIEEKN